MWTKDDALTIEVLADGPGVFDFNVTRCRYAETYRAMGLGGIGDILSCDRDGAFCEGYDPRIKLTRTQTIMGGASVVRFPLSCERRGAVERLKRRRRPPQNGLITTLNCDAMGWLRHREPRSVIASDRSIENRVASGRAAAGGREKG